MFATATLRGWPKTGQPPIQAVGVKIVPNGVTAYLMHVKPNKSRARTVTLQLYDDKGKPAERVRVAWPRWTDCDRKNVKLEAC